MSWSSSKKCPQACFEPDLCLYLWHLKFMGSCMIQAFSKLGSASLMLEAYFLQAYNFARVSEPEPRLVPFPLLPTGHKKGFSNEWAALRLILTKMLLFLFPGGGGGGGKQIGRRMGFWNLKTYWWKFIETLDTFLSHLSWSWLGLMIRIERLCLPGF